MLRFSGGSTGSVDMNARRLVDHLHAIAYHRSVSARRLREGDVTELLPVLHFVLLDYSPHVAAFVAAKGFALYFSRAPIAWWRDGFTNGLQTTLPHPAPLRHIGIYAYRVAFLRMFPQLAQAPIEVTESLEQLRALWHGYRIAVYVADHAPGSGVDTPEDLERVRALFLTQRGL